MPPDYNYYLTAYFGHLLSETDFPRLTARASAYLAGVIKTPEDIPEEAYKQAVCAVAEAWLINEQGGDVLSQSVGPWSKTFAAKPKTNEQRLNEAANLYLKPYQDLNVRWI